MSLLDSLLHLATTHPVPLVITLLLTYILTTIVHRIYFHPLSSYPGPFLARFTDFYSFYGVFHAKRTILQYELLQHYGSPFRFSTNELVFSDVTTASEIYGQSSALPLKERTIHEALSATGEASLLTLVDRQRHARVRRLLGSAFGLRGILEYEYVIAEKVEVFVDVALRPEGTEEERCSDVYVPVHELFLDIISDLSFGKGKGFDSLRDVESTALGDVSAFGKVIPPQAFFPGFRYLPVKAIQEGFAGVGRLVNFAQGHVRRYQETVKQGGGAKSILKNMFEAKDEEGEERLTEREVVENTIIFLVGGTTSSAGTVIYFLWECGRRPEVMARLVREVRTAFPDPDVFPKYEEVVKLTFLSHVIDETLRLWSPLNTGVPRISTGRSIGGSYFPAGAGVSNNSYATARDPNVFPDPLTFNPDRWRETTPEMRTLSRPFSIGPRNCIGKHLAMVGIYLTLARVIQQFDITTDQSMTEDRMRQKDTGMLTPWDEALLLRIKYAKRSATNPA